MGSPRVSASFRLPRLPRARGFSLIEVLVAIVVLSFGVLGAVGLQAASLQANKEARNQSSAVRLARELGEMMRGNKDVALASTGNPYLVSYASDDSLPAEGQDCSAVACGSTTALAQFQMRDWLSRLRQELPGARARVCLDATPYASATGLPRWECSSGGGVTVVKIGWTRQSTDRSATGAGAVDRATAPGIVLALIAGSES